MLRERDEPMNLCALGPALSLAMEPVLTRLETWREDDTLFQTVKRDLARRVPRTPTTGRPSTPGEVMLRLLVVKHL